MKRLVFPVAAIVLLSSCSGGTPPDVGGPGDVTQREALVRYAHSFEGTPYRMGGASRDGMDCSGLVIRVYDHFGLALPRTSAEQSQVGETVDKSDLMGGDLVFFRTTRREQVTHVGIYVGAGKFIHASTSARRVRVDELDSAYFRRRFAGARRVMPE